MSKFNSSFIPTLHYFTNHLSEPTLRDALSPHAAELITAEAELTQLQAEAAAAKRRRDAAHDAVRTASGAVDATLEPLAAACIVAKVGPRGRPFGAHEPTITQLRTRRPAAKTALVKAMAASKLGTGPAVDEAAKATLDAVSVLDGALDVATGAERELGIHVAKRDAVAANARTRLVALKRYAVVALRDKPEAGYFRGALPKLLRASRRVQRDAVAPPTPPGDGPVVPVTPHV